MEYKYNKIFYSETTILINQFIHLSQLGLTNTKVFVFCETTARNADVKSTTEQIQQDTQQPLIPMIMNLFELTVLLHTLLKVAAVF